MIVGIVNTLVLLTSSLTMVLAHRAPCAEGRTRGRPSLLLAARSLLGGVVFLVNKVLRVGGEDPPRALSQLAGPARATAGRALFFGLYFTMTGLHGLHVHRGHRACWP